jgi:hypothetical protein
MGQRWKMMHLGQVNLPIHRKAFWEIELGLNHYGAPGVCETPKNHMASGLRTDHTCLSALPP